MTFIDAVHARKNAIREKDTIIMRQNHQLLNFIDRCSKEGGFEIRWEANLSPDCITFLKRKGFLLRDFSGVYIISWY